METKVGFFEVTPGVRSVSRVLLAAVVGVALLLTITIILRWLFTTKDLSTEIASVVSGCLILFGGMTSIVVTWKLIQNTQETEDDKVTNQAEIAKAQVSPVSVKTIVDEAKAVINEVQTQ